MSSIEFPQSEGLIIENDIRSEILALRQQVFVMGNNDSEKSQFEDILYKFDQKVISGEQALEQAHQILNRKIMR